MNMSRHSVVRLAAGTILLGLLTPLGAQRPERPPSRYSRNHENVRKAFRDVVAKARQSTVRVLAGDKQVVLGTVVDADGYIVTKASELPESAIVCHLDDGRELPARIIGTHERNDLAMLKIDAKGLVPVSWSKELGCRPGSWLATPGLGELPVSIGVMSAKVHDRRDRRDRNRAYLGVRTDQETTQQVRLAEVLPGTAAEAAGLRRDDVILEFDDTAVHDPRHFSSTIGRRKPGDKVKIKVRRHDEELVLEATLRKNDDRRGPLSNQEPLWGPLSDVRIGFDEVIQHDSILKPKQCGGPLVNLDGEVVGINIARVGRMETLALTGKVVRSMLEDLKK
jgi:serine protease Do